MKNQKETSPRIGYYPNQSPEKKGLRRGARFWIPIVLCAAVFVISTYFLLSYYWDRQRIQQMSAELRQEYYATLPAEPTPPKEESSTLAPSVQVTDASPTATPAPVTNLTGERARLTAYPENPGFQISDRFRRLQERNSDIIGWLTIDGVLDDAVVQRDNSYYLKRDYLGYHNVNGALFLDENCLLRTVPEQLVIHGHNMKTGAMFGILKKYKVKGASFYREHPIIRFDHVYEDAEYVIFAVAEISTRPENPNYFNFIGYSSFSTDQDFLTYVSRLRALSLYSCKVDVKPDDRLITLATCTGGEDDARMLVAGRMIRPGEDRLALNVQIFSTTDR